MSIRSFYPDWRNGALVKPRIVVLEVRARDCADAEPIAKLLVELAEQVELCPSTGVVDRASVSLRYQQIYPRLRDGVRRTGEFQGSYSRAWNEVSLTSKSGMHGAVFLDLPGLEGNRIGSYLMNEIVEWSQRWPEASVKPIELLSLQATRENKDRRNRFYEQFNIRFEYTDPASTAGLSIAMHASELTASYTWQRNISVVFVPDYLDSQLAEAEAAGWRISDLERSLSMMLASQRRRQPFLRTQRLGLFVGFAVGVIGAVVVLALHYSS